MDKRIIKIEKIINGLKNKLRLDKIIYYFKIGKDMFFIVENPREFIELIFEGVLPQNKYKYPQDIKNKYKDFELIDYSEELKNTINRISELFN